MLGLLNQLEPLGTQAKFLSDHCAEGMDQQEFLTWHTTTEGIPPLPNAP